MMSGAVTAGLAAAHSAPAATVNWTGPSGSNWGTGSNWENAAWFSLDTHEALPAFDFLGRKYKRRKR